MNHHRSPLCAAVLSFVLAGSSYADDFDELLSSVRNAGDVDGDGTNDLMITDRKSLPAAVWIVSGKTRELLFTLHSEYRAEGLPGATDRLGDINGDGKSDVIVAWRVYPSADPSCGGGNGHASAYSGADGRVLFTFQDTWTVAAAGDINADGTPDILLGASHLWRYGKAGRVQVRSGRDGSLLVEKFGRTPDPNWFSADEPDNFGIGLAGLGDVDNDGYGDFVIGVPGEPSNFATTSSSIELFSGRDGRAITKLEGETNGRDNIGWSMVSLGDVNQDGVCDLLAGAIHVHATVYSGRDLQRIHTMRSRRGKAILDSFASSLDSLGDVDGDGLSDWIVGANESMTGSSFDEGYAQVYSSHDGKMMRVEFESKRVGVDVCGLGDVNGDHVPDEVIACPAEGWVRVLSGKYGELIEQIAFDRLRKATPKNR